MTKNVEITINIKVARRMLGVAGIDCETLKKMTDDEIFEKVLQMNEMYGMTYKI